MLQDAWAEKEEDFELQWIISRFDYLRFFVVAWRAENLFLHRIHAGHNWMYLCSYVYFYVENRKEEDSKSECSGSQQEDIEEMAQSEEMRKHKLLYNNKFILHNLSQHEILMFVCVWEAKNTLSYAKFIVILAFLSLSLSLSLIASNVPFKMIIFYYFSIHRLLTQIFALFVQFFSVF